jgi:hypothetical protein
MSVEADGFIATDLIGNGQTLIFTLFGGGVVDDTLVDEGWMDIRLGDETAHSAPQPMRVSTRDIPVDGTNSLLAASLDASWVEFTNITVEGVVVIEGDKLDEARGNLPHIEIRFKDSSGVEAVSWMYQPSARDVKTGDQLRIVRGFMRVEMPGRIVLLSDKEEDLVR